MGTIIFICPFCKIEVNDDDNVVLGEKDNPNILELDKDTDKVVCHVSCLEKQRKC